MDEDYEYKLEWIEEDMPHGLFFRGVTGLTEEDCIRIKKTDGMERYVILWLPWNISIGKAFSSLHEAKVWCEKNYIFALERELERMKG